MTIAIRPPSLSHERDRINLRLEEEVILKIDAMRRERAGNVSRNTWIAEAIEEKLRRDQLEKLASGERK